MLRQLYFIKFEMIVQPKDNHFYVWKKNGRNWKVFLIMNLSRDKQNRKFYNASGTDVACDK